MKGRDAPANCSRCSTQIRAFLQDDEEWYPCTCCDGKLCEGCCQKDNLKQMKEEVKEGPHVRREREEVPAEDGRR